MHKWVIIFMALSWAMPAPGACAADESMATASELTLTGRVLLMPEILKLKEIKADTAPLENQVALLADNGRVLPLLSDEGGRVFFLDNTMRNRPTRLKLKIPQGLPYAQVIGVEVMHEGRWRVPQYYCDVCTIAVRYPQICLCCQGPMEFRLKPER